MRLLAELEEFVTDHRPHGTLTGDATAPAWNGYRLTVACPCGVVFERWVSDFLSRLIQDKPELLCLSSQNVRSKTIVSSRPD